MFWKHVQNHVTAGKNMLIHSITKLSPYMAFFKSNPGQPFGCRALEAPNRKKTEKFEE